MTYIVSGGALNSTVYSLTGKFAIGGDDRGRSSIFVFVLTVQRFNFVLQYDGFVDDNRTRCTAIQSVLYL